MFFRFNNETKSYLIIASILFIILLLINCSEENSPTNIIPDPVTPIDYYVNAVSGSNYNDGSEQSPFRTSTIPIFGSGLGNGLWLILIGWFLNSAAVQSYRRVVIQDILEDVPISQMMRRQAATVSPDCSISDLVHKHVMDSDERAFPVTQNEQLAGMVTIDDIREVSKDDWDHTRVRQIMTPANELVTLDMRDDASEAFNKLAQRDVRQLPVVKGSELLGLLRRRDIIRWLQLQSDAELT